MAEDDMPEHMPRMDQLTREASLWFARMRGPDAETWRPQFEHWLGLGAAHRGAYNRAGEIFALGRFMAAQDEEPGDEANDNEEVGGRWKWTAIAASLLLALGIAGWVASERLPGTGHAPVQIAQPKLDQPVEQQRYATTNGTQRTVQLADRSSVELSANSQLSTHFTSLRRELRLDHGRARFDVAHEGRPFVVFAGGGRVTARGTVFDVILGADERVTVRLLRGAVDVERPRTVKGAGGPTAVARLEPGETLSFAAITPAVVRPVPDRAELQPTVPPPDLALVREYERTPLAAVIAEANQDLSTAIRLGDPSIGTLRVSGRFRVNDADQVADRLATLFDLEVERTKADEITLRKR
ncbi:Transmembrane sensor OS=Sphingobium scionense OX=1404341 GN=GGQ90_005666 PE=4 SV=1 [Sphingobium scionense]